MRYKFAVHFKVKIFVINGIAIQMLLMKNIVYLQSFGRICKQFRPQIKNIEFKNLAALSL